MLRWLQRIFRRPVLTAPVDAPWPFDRTPDAPAITTRQVIEGAQEIHVVVHYADDHTWAFLCGTTDDKADGRVVPMRDAVGMDETVREIADLPPGWKAWREKRGGEWVRSEIGEPV